MTAYNNEYSDIAVKEEFYTKPNHQHH